MSVVKSGYLRKHSKSLLSGGWNTVWVVLYKDSNLVVYKKQGDSSAMGTINLFEVRKWFAYGQYTSGMPERPSPPSGSSYDQILAIPQKPSKKAKVHWFLANSDQEIHSWMDAICGVLPPPPQKEEHHKHQAAPIQAQSAPSVSSAPPPYPGGPPPDIGFAPMPQPSAYPQQQPYPQQAPYPQQPPPPQGYAPPPQGYAPPPQGYAPPPQPGYPQQAYYPAPAPHYAPPPPAPVGYPQQQYYAPQGGYYPQQGYQHPPTTVVYQQQPKKGFLSSNTGKMAMGVAGGAALGYGLSRMGGGMMGMGMGGMGWGMRGSWSSLSSFGSFGSCGSFGSFGSW